MFGFFKKKASKMPDADTLIAQMHERTGAADRAAELPAWALILRSPFQSYDSPARSWLGGVPRAPKSFRWPTSPSGQPLHFIAQIDLASLHVDQFDAMAPNGLPAAGALLVFIGETYDIRVLSPHDVDGAGPVSPPFNLPSLRNLDFFGDTPLFNCWAVDPVGYVSDGTPRPSAFPDPFEHPIDWIDTHGLADIDVSLLITAMERELAQIERLRQVRLQDAVAGQPEYKRERITARYEHFAHVEQHGPSVLDQLLEWRRYVQSKSAEHIIDTAALDDVLKIRAAYRAPMTANYGTREHLAGDANIVWEHVLRTIPKGDNGLDFLKTPLGLRCFVERKITDWRGHRLLGLEPEFPNNWEDRRGQDPFLSIAADPILATESEHEYGLSIWLNRHATAHGQFGGGQLIRHCAV